MPTLEKAFDTYTGVDTPDCASRAAQEQQGQLLATAIEELAGLRFSIVITAKWEADRDESPERRAEIHAELASLRASYHDKIDQIAMSLGVSQAMIAKDEVEHRITLPLRTKLAT